jgi:hypothetical protein
VYKILKESKKALKTRSKACSQNKIGLKANKSD